VGESRELLASAYDLAMLDLDGVVYVGAEAVPGVSEHLEEASRSGMALAYVTNNASRPPEAVAEHLRRLGVRAEPADVVTSAQAAARLVSERCAEGDRVFVIGGTGLFRALEELGLEGTQEVDAGPTAVVSGYAPDLAWQTVIEGSVLIRQGVFWVASNTDRTIPTRHGPGPGAGVLVGAISGYAGVEPVVAGKPEPPLFLETQRRCGGRRPLVVGDRLDTDIEGATRAGFDSLLVMTGVTGLREVVTASPELRPTYVGADLGALARAATAVRQEDGRWVQGSWSAWVDGSGSLTVTGGPDTADAWWQVVAAASWAHLDATGNPVDTGRLAAPDPGGTALPG
jgi:HAD superfamily hydrolase (TIGR01450 family)